MNDSMQSKANQRLVGLNPGSAAMTAAETADVGSAAKTDAGTSPSIHTAEATMSTTAYRRHLPERKIIRADFHDYSGGDYFITICTKEKSHYFGEVHDGMMNFTEVGRFAHQALQLLSTHYSYVEVPLFVVMPNHVHAIVCICPSPEDMIPSIRTALGVVVGGYKQSVTRFARRNNISFGWQSRYYDHIIRGDNDGNRIAEYIENNVARWASDCYRGK